MKKIINKMIKKILLVAIISISIIACATPKKVVENDYVGAFKTTKFFINNYSYNKDKKIDKNLSIFIFDTLINNLDPSKMIFTKKNLNEFELKKEKIGQMNEEEFLNFGLEIINRYKINIDIIYDYAINLVKEYNFDFNTNENFYYNRDDLDFPKNDSELEILWYKRVLNDVERLKLVGDNKEKIIEILSKRYSTQKKNILKFTLEEEIQIIINSYVTAFDPHNTWFSVSSAKSFEISSSLSLVGMGAQIQQRAEGNVITKLIAGGPAKKSNKFNIGDIFVYVGEGENGELVDVSNYRLNDLVKLIRGEEGSVVRIGVKRDENSPVRIIRLVREKIKQEDEQISTKIINIDDKKVGYILIPGFYSKSIEGEGRDVSSDLLDEINKFNKKDNISSMVIDLRGNGGGSLSEVIKMLGYFIGKNKVAVQVRDIEGKIRKYYTNESKKWDKPLVVMIDRNSASASEIFAGAIKDYNRGIIVGSNTWGKGSVQRVSKLDFIDNDIEFNMGIFKYTINMFFRANGSSTQVKGVAPDIIFTNLDSELDAGENKEYKNALKWETINNAVTNKFSLNKSINYLISQHKQRIKNDEKWELLLEEENYANENYGKKYITLNYKKREQERKEKAKKQEYFKEKAKKVGIPSETIFVLDSGLAYNEENIEEINKKEKTLKEYIDPYTIEASKISLELIK